MGPGNAGVVQGGAREERGRPGASAPPGGLRDLHPHPAEPPPLPPSTLRNTDTQPVPRGERRQPPPCPGEGTLRRGTITATARGTGRLRDKSPGDGAALAPSGVSSRPPERPESPRTGQIRATRSPDPGSSLGPSPFAGAARPWCPLGPRCPGQGSCPRGRQGPAALRAHLPCAPRRGRRRDRDRGADRDRDRDRGRGLGPGPSAPPPAPGLAPPPGNSQPDGQAARPIGGRRGVHKGGRGR